MAGLFPAIFLRLLLKAQLCQGYKREQTLIQTLTDRVWIYLLHMDDKRPVPKKPIKSHFLSFFFALECVNFWCYDKSMIHVRKALRRDARIV
jgi:hypothetical protein